MATEDKTWIFKIILRMILLSVFMAGIHYLNSWYGNLTYDEVTFYWLFAIMTIYILTNF